LKAVALFLVLAIWISSWFPTSPDIWSISTAAGFILGLIAALRVQRLLGDRSWPARIVSVLAYLALIGGALSALLVWAIGTPVDGAIWLFSSLGFVGYLLMISDVLSPVQGSKGHFGTGTVVLVLISAWSWASASSMYFHRGVPNDTVAACILVPKSLHYDTALNSIWEMRLPEVATNRTGPTGTVILNYHAILVVPYNRQTRIYNWSKKWMRFEILDPERNPYLPRECPKFL
jgi:hypothetical protein